MKRIVRDIFYFNFLSFLSSKLREEKEFFVDIKLPRGFFMNFSFLNSIYNFNFFIKLNGSTELANP